MAGKKSHVTGIQQFSAQLKGILEAGIPGARADVSEPNATGKVNALLVSDEFQGVTDQARQELVWNLLRRQLGQPELMQVSFVLTSTPEEDEALQAWPPNAD